MIKKIFNTDLPISFIRRKKFTSNPIFGTFIGSTCLKAKYELEIYLRQTINKEFLK